MSNSFSSAALEGQVSSKACYSTGCWDWSTMRSCSDLADLRSASCNRFWSFCWKSLLSCIDQAICADTFASYVIFFALSNCLPWGLCSRSHSSIDSAHCSRLTWPLSPSQGIYSFPICGAKAFRLDCFDQNSSFSDALARSYLWLNVLRLCQSPCSSWLCPSVRFKALMWRTLVPFTSVIDRYQSIDSCNSARNHQNLSLPCF